MHAWSDLDFAEFARTRFLDIPDEDIATAGVVLLTERRLAGEVPGKCG